PTVLKGCASLPLLLHPTWGPLVTAPWDVCCVWEQPPLSHLPASCPRPPRRHCPAAWASPHRPLRPRPTLVQPGPRSVANPVTDHLVTHLPPSDLRQCKLFPHLGLQSYQARGEINRHERGDHTGCYGGCVRFGGQ